MREGILGDGKEIVEGLKEGGNVGEDTKMMNG